MKKSKLSHIEINVSNYSNSIKFYDSILPKVGFERINCTKEFTAYSDGSCKIILSPTEKNYLKNSYHRKNTGLNHLAFYLDSKEEVDDFNKFILDEKSIMPLYSELPQGDCDYYAVYFEDPDRIKLEVVYAPKYCDLNSWPSNIEDDFDPSDQENSRKIKYITMRKDHWENILNVASSLIEHFTESGLEQLALDLKTQKGLVVLLDSSVEGFITYFSYQGAVEIGWMGISKKCQGSGLGKGLIKELVKELKELGFKKVQVKTLDESVEYEPYEKTRQFYYSQGFQKKSVNYYEDNPECEAESVLELSFITKN